MVVGLGGLGQREGLATGTRSAPFANSGSTLRSTARAVSAFSSSERPRSVEPWMRPRLRHQQPER